MRSEELARADRSIRLYDRRKRLHAERHRPLHCRRGRNEWTALLSGDELPKRGRFSLHDDGPVPARYREEQNRYLALRRFPYALVEAGYEVRDATPLHS